MKSKENTINSDLITEETFQKMSELKNCIEQALKLNDIAEYSFLVESLADIKNEIGLYEEARSDLLSIIDLNTEPFNKARINRKIAYSHTLQKTYWKAEQFISTAESLLQKIKSDTDKWHTEYINTLLVKNDVLYYGGESLDKIIQNNEEIKKLLPDWGNEEQKLQYYRHVLFIAYRRYRYFNFPDEILSHAFYYRYLAQQKNDSFYIADNLEHLGFIYLWRGEFKCAIDNFKKCIETLRGKQSDLLMIASNYIAIAYRMTNKMSECEEWTNKAIQLAEKMVNTTYQALMLGNLGWLSLKRNNQLYVEEYCLKGFSLMTEFKHPMLWITVMPLINLYSIKKDWDQAGKFAHSLLHPSVQKLPDILEDYLKQAVIKWQMEEWETIEDIFDALITESKLLHYH